jgi:hypothetical protein
MLGYASSVSLQWLFILTLYGTFIPNTWRRCAAVVAVLAASQLILYAVWGLWVRPLDPLTFGRGLSVIGFWLVVSAVIAVVSWLLLHAVIGVVFLFASSSRFALMLRASSFAGSTNLSSSTLTSSSLAS